VVAHRVPGCAFGVANETRAGRVCMAVLPATVAAG
jgi:hypothetical protein